MKQLPFAFIICLLISALPALGLETPEDLRQEVEQAIKNGKALYDVYRKGPVSEKQVEGSRNRINDFCEFPYKAYVLGKVVYFIAEPPSPGSIVFGRHYKVTQTDVVRSTETCFNLAPPPSNAVGVFTTNPFTEAPTEFHVFLSLKYKNPIYVGTKVGTWRVRDGGIEFVGRRK